MDDNNKTRKEILWPIIVTAFVVGVLGAFSLGTRLNRGLTTPTQTTRPIISFLFAEYDNPDKMPSGLYIENVGGRTAFVDSVIMKTKDNKILKITDDPSWSSALTSIGLGDQIHYFQRPYYFNPVITVSNCQTLPFVAFVRCDRQRTVVEDVKEKLRVNPMIVFYHD